MKKTNLVLVASFLLLSTLIFMGLRFNAGSGITMDGKYTYSGVITFNYRAEDGGRTLLPSKTESDTLGGSASDTLYSDVFRNKGHTAIQLVIDSTKQDLHAIVKIQTALQGGVIPSAVPESHFIDQYWVSFDSGDVYIDCVVKTSPDSITCGGITPVIQLPLLDSQLFRLVVIPTVLNDSTFTFSGKLLLKEY